MEYIITPYSEPVPPVVYYDDAFTDQELNWLQERASNATVKAAVNGGHYVNNRRSQVYWLSNTSESMWVFERLAHVISILNAKFFNYNLTGFGEKLQLTNYEHSENGMYAWHQDYGGQISRKLSLVLQLTDPSRYEGGNLQTMTSQDVNTVRKQRGLITVFPSFTLHQVTPVTQGSRQSMVAWVSGPAFK